MTDPLSPTPQRQPRKTPIGRRRRLLWVLVAVLAFSAFEVGIRAIPPDAVQISVTPSGLFGAGPTLTHTDTNPASVAAIQGFITNHPTSYPAWFPFSLQNPQCNGGFGEIVTYRFTWHGIPVEVANGDSGNCGNLVFVACSSGGLTAPFLYQPPDSY